MSADHRQAVRLADRRMRSVDPQRTPRRAQPSPATRAASPANAAWLVVQVDLRTTSPQLDGCGWKARRGNRDDQDASRRQPSFALAGRLSPQLHRRRGPCHLPRALALGWPVGSRPRATTAFATAPGLTSPSSRWAVCQFPESEARASECGAHASAHRVVARGGRRRRRPRAALSGAPRSVASPPCTPRLERDSDNTIVPNSPRSTGIRSRSLKLFDRWIRG